MRNSRRGGLVACAVLCAVAAGCAREEAPAEEPPPPAFDEQGVAALGGGRELVVEEPPRPAFDEQGVVNEAWRILKMATAHDVITLEVEVADLGTASDVARELMAPLEARYAEALIYVYAAGEGEGGHLPAMRFQWTADGGVVVLRY